MIAKTFVAVFTEAQLNRMDTHIQDTQKNEKN